MKLLGSDGRKAGWVVAELRFWLAVLLGCLLLIVSVLWNVQHIQNVRAQGWLAALNLNEATTLHIAATFVGLLVVYVIQVRLAVALFVVLRERLQSRKPN